MTNPTVPPALLETLKEDARSYLEANGMSEQEHTPGPWTAEGVFVSHNTGEGLDYSHTPVALVDSGETKTTPACRRKHAPYLAEAYANARLIAAAPELLEAAASYLHDPRPENADRLADVITRARGGNE